MLYFNVVPEMGSYVFRVRVARVAGASGVVAAGAVVVGAVLDLEGLAEGGVRVYFEVIRVCELLVSLRFGGEIGI